MSNPIRSLTAVLLCLCLPHIVEAQQSSVVVPAPGYKVIVYPTEVYFGNPIYIAIYKKNITEEPHSYNIAYDWDWFFLSLQSDGISVPYHLLREGWYGHLSSVAHRLPDSAMYHFQPGESKLIFAFYRELPTLEDMNHPFWKEAKKKLKDGKNVVAGVTAESRGAVSPITVKPRPGAEMELLKSWLAGTPESLLPIPLDRALADSNNLFDQWSNKLLWWMEDQCLLEDKYGAFSLTPMPDFVSTERLFKTTRYNSSFFPSNERFIKVQGQEHFPYFFLQRGNRKPGDPVCPETWQGWKELEESLALSTMRDEIRLVRIIVQYCDTRDESVLKELKEWFGKMNEIQRMVMAESFRDRAMMSFCGTAFRHGRDVSRYAGNLRTPFREIYRAIREHDIAPIPSVTGKDVNLLPDYRP
jgi:hypothetical protein